LAERDRRPHERFAIEIAESDYARLATLGAIVAYLRGRLS